MNIREEIIERRKNRRKKWDNLKQDVEHHVTELERLRYVADNTRHILDSLDVEFCKRTSLEISDLKFLFTAIALQCLRIYVINELTKVEKAGNGNTKESALHKFQKKILGNFEDDRIDTNKEYHASLSHIITTTGVPYDATNFSDVKLDFFKGANHRFATFGHDPIIGIILGTANILTNTITCKTSNSIPIPITCHVVYDGNGKNPKISSIASTISMLQNAADRLDGDIKSVLAALIKQFIHIGTDLYTPCGIQIPGANLILTNEYAEKLTKFISTGDIIKFGTSYKMLNLINTIIATVHTLTLTSSDEMDVKLHNIKTKKILLYSNAIATGSNVIYNAVRAYLGDAKALKNVDFAGLFSVITMLMSDYEYKKQIKEEFVFGNYDRLISERRYTLLSDYGEQLDK